MDKNNFSWWGCFGAFVAIGLIVIVGIWLGGIAFSKLWEWFVLPVFEKAPMITTNQAIGISLLINFVIRSAVTMEYKSDKNKTLTQGIIKAAVVTIGTPLFALLMGWIYRGLM